MEAFSYKPSIGSINSCDSGLLVPSFSTPKKLSFCWKSKKVGIFACKDEAKVDGEDGMGLKLGKVLSDDPKLTLSKIIGRNSDRDISNLRIDKLLYKNNDKGLSYNREVVSKKGVNLEVDKPSLSSVKKPSPPILKAVDNMIGSVPHVILRKPSALLQDDNGTNNLLKFKIQPNLSLTMGKGKEKERFSDFTLVTKTEAITSSDHGKHDYFVNESALATSYFEKNSIKVNSLSASKSDDMTLNVKSELLEIHQEQNSSEDRNVSTSVEDLSVVGDYGHINDSLTGSQPLQQSSLGSSLKSDPSVEESEEKLINASSSTSKEASLHKPTRLNQSVKTTSSVLVDKELVSKHTTFGSSELEDLPTSSPINETEDIDWATAEDLVKTGQRDEVELISASTRGFVVSFGSLVGFLPYRNLAPKYKYFAFETWLRYKGLDPTMYKQSLSIIGSSENTAKATALYSSLDIQIDQELTSNMELEELLTIYDNEKLRYMTSFLDKKLKVYVIFADRKSRRLIFSVKAKEKEESIEKKKNLMGKLSIGEVVKCCITKITYFGIFVEVEGVPAMIHQTEVSWDVSVNPTLCFKIGQIVEAKVHQLDFSLERIFLSLKEVVPDPLTKSLEAVDHVTQSRESATAEADTEWPYIEKLLEELHQIEGINSVSKGRFFLSPDFTPTFQVYMASMFENQYKLLARSGNKVQEVIVETSLAKEDMKSAILTCTNRFQS